MELPNPDPRPEGEVRELERIWATPRGWRMVTAVNNTVIGLLYIGVAFLFFLMAGLLAVVMRTQLAVGDNRLIDQDLYNQMFTVHGTTMMFLFAVPAVEALGVMLLPQMLAARDLPFPRLSAFAIWAYVVGGLVFFSTIFYDLAPKGGWFMYPPLTLMEYSPGDNADFWLLGIGFIEISAIAGAVEIVVGALRTRPPGMSLARMPIFAWTMLIFASMIMFAFPAVILATMMLEIERAFGWPFFTAAVGGDPLLWQHLFWFFGHPEVYIIFLPAAGLVSMMVPTMARTPLVGYHLIVVALIGTGFFSFGLWVHHMFTTGIPALSLAFFSAASMAVAVPSGIQVFSWIATIAAGRQRFRITTASLFILGFLFIFTLGGLTGVMVAMVPFDHQVHDTYFVVAHFHYVLIGGFVFPLFAAIYYWMPLFSRRMLSERVGRWVFWMMFVGFNVTFLPMHLTGLRGMPRRVWTYPGEMGWDTLNLISTAGTYVLAAGILVFLVDLAAKFRIGNRAVENPWGAGTLEWLPNDVYSTRSIPHITSREPLWDRPSLPQEVRDGHHYLPNAPTGWRETIVTSPIHARPQYVIQMPGPGWPPFLAAVFTAAFFLLLTVKMVAIAVICGVLAIVFVLAWAWGLDPGPSKGMIEIAKGVRLPTYMSGPTSHSWWAMVVLMFVAGSLYLAYVFSYLFLWVVSPEVWAPAGSPAPPPIGWPAGSAALLLAGSGILWLVSRKLQQYAASRLAMSAALLLSLVCLTAAFMLETCGHLTTGLNPGENAYGAMVYLGAVLFAQLVLALLIMGLFTLARHLAGKLDAVRRVTYDNYALLYYYTVAQSLLGLGLIHGFPRLIG
ncbi:cytochrome c oxidase subunit I [Sinorhizobium medicae]|uniref:cytochrome-c oxidase n=2 Tax=Sinorhizobium medicae TaxID=110321 RepID=A0A508X8X1_9HYPH|nr:cytochrome c oxidase subunit I [Sinorhizobium medicae]ABR63559.1 Cytochrome c oxidase subunit I type [Sinorhizobium medicae WSM419]MBO1941841.1 cytochrome c oxidase subunit I [Sinorhizobium medicae]MDX0434175.1 cytochrome c oxidase subunit I [Sinorhizobium medicae]MDX0514084.1 cytochrome c oxidase subunit I [Sinorhizobium medicae]MDX0520780.1 cytochrome c oxidase subunit I [Sinorhizobium medicae]